MDEDLEYLKSVGAACEICGELFPNTHGYPVACTPCWVAAGAELQTMFSLSLTETVDNTNHYDVYTDY